MVAVGGRWRDPLLKILLLHLPRSERSTLSRCLVTLVVTLIALGVYGGPRHSHLAQPGAVTDLRNDPKSVSE